MALAQRFDSGPSARGRDIPDVAQLVPLIVQGDEIAFARFYEATSGLLFGLLLLMLGDTASAERVLREVYSEVSEHPGRFDRAHETLLAWLITITHRRALEQLCASIEDRRFLVSVGLANAAAPGRANSASISRSAHRRLVAATLNSISPNEQRIIELAYFSRLTPTAIAARMGRPDSAVRSGLDYAVSRLYGLFQNQGSVVGGNVVAGELKRRTKKARA